MKNERIGAEEIYLAPEDGNAADVVSYGLADYGVMTLCDDGCDNGECDDGYDEGSDSGDYDEGNDEGNDDSECEGGSNEGNDDDYDDSYDDGDDDCCGDDGDCDDDNDDDYVDSSSNTMSTAIELTLNRLQNGHIACTGDEVWYKFTPDIILK